VKVDLRTEYALAVLCRSVARDLSRSLPLKEKLAKELPFAWRLALVRASLACELLLCGGEAELLFTPKLMQLRKDTETSEILAEMGHNDQNFV
jgi:hypothetical protein